MTRVLLHRSYKARQPGVIFDIPQAEAEGVETLGIGEILKEEQPAPKKAGKGSDAE
ncbi:hypothetical protein Rleg2_2422 [Rhizobium leguminosarum bv. trifolii WSM2304]|uniref:Uncharacterized protein n=1 Tax=Rhizobium leguminosarum bv. trifolii (strain WSM2304) TaxID=395492 RepID=A0ABF7QNY8_RHILW|nr:hypothetical protein [Rhizobium leguminosarum]ACI55696.1 hypothetical protein Rleg2_2422 [Rhizobium leguminosarum bv. trifolii WSM2304]